MSVGSCDSSVVFCFSPLSHRGVISLTLCFDCSLCRANIGAVLLFEFPSLAGQLGLPVRQPLHPAVVVGRHRFQRSFRRLELRAARLRFRCRLRFLRLLGLFGTTRNISPRCPRFGGRHCLDLLRSRTPRMLHDDAWRRQRLCGQRGVCDELSYASREQVSLAAPGLEGSLLTRCSDIGIIEASDRPVNLQLLRTSHTV